MGFAAAFRTLAFLVVLGGCAAPNSLVVRFASGSDEPMGDDEGRAIRRVYYHMDGDAKLRLVIIGHADAVGDASSNTALSLRRARRVRRLVLASGIPASRVAVSAYGEGRSRVENDSDEGRAANRRVELFFYYPDRGSLTRQYGASLQVFRE